MLNQKSRIFKLLLMKVNNGRGETNAIELFQAINIQDI